MIPDAVPERQRGRPWWSQGDTARGGEAPHPAALRIPTAPKAIRYSYGSGPGSLTNVMLFVVSTAEMLTHSTVIGGLQSGEKVAVRLIV
jgi:hypothetical protein